MEYEEAYKQAKQGLITLIEFLKDIQRRRVALVQAKADYNKLRNVLNEEKLVNEAINVLIKRVKEYDKNKATQMQVHNNFLIKYVCRGGELSEAFRKIINSGLQADMNDLYHCIKETIEHAEGLLTIINKFK